MPIGFVIGLSIALLIAGAQQLSVNADKKPNQPELSQIERAKAALQGRLYMYVGFFTLIGTLIELLVR